MNVKARNWLIATRNAHKVGEIQSILGAEFRYFTLNDLPGAPAVVEDANTFAGNATKKAVELARYVLSSGALKGNGPMAILADDSGLEVDALNGAPGVVSARFAAIDSARAGNSSDAENCAKLLRLMKDVPEGKRTARFRCVIAVVRIDPGAPEFSRTSSPVCDADELELGAQLFDGVCEGRIEFSPRGNGGFGYDPLFVPAGYDQTFGELAEHVKNTLSHRARALEKLKDS